MCIIQFDWTDMNLIFSPKNPPYNNNNNNNYKVTLNKVCQLPWVCMCCFWGTFFEHKTIDEELEEEDNYNA